MLPDDLFDLIHPVLRPLGSATAEGEAFRDPPLEVLRLYHRPVRLHWLPLVGRAQSVVAVARQPADLGFSTEGSRQLLRRLAMAVNGRFPPWTGLVVGLTAVILTPEPIRPGDDAILQTALAGMPRLRTVPLGVLRLNLGQEAMACALTRGPDGLFPEPEALADALSERLRRFVPKLEI
jgi:hypothetical protein